MGGLLATRTREASLTASGDTFTFSEQAYQFPSYDGNGNIIAWTDDAGGSTTTRNFDAFGNVVSNQGERWSGSTAFGFSTKYEDVETGLLYYGYRYYDPVTGRWPSRDPIEEEGGINLYGMVGNDLVNKWDYLGLEEPKNAKAAPKMCNLCESVQIYLRESEPGTWLDLTATGRPDQGKPLRPFPKEGGVLPVNTGASRIEWLLGVRKTQNPQCTCHDGKDVVWSFTITSKQLFGDQGITIGYNNAFSSGNGVMQGYKAMPSFDAGRNAKQKHPITDVMHDQIYILRVKVDGLICLEREFKIDKSKKADPATLGATPLTQGENVGNVWETPKKK